MCLLWILSSHKSFSSCFMIPFMAWMYCVYEHGFVVAEEDVRHVGEETAKGDEDGSGGTSLRRACSLSDLNKPNVSRRILPSPPNNGISNLIFIL